MSTLFWNPTDFHDEDGDEIKEIERKRKAGRLFDVSYDVTNYNVPCEISIFLQIRANA